MPPTDWDVRFRDLLPRFAGVLRQLASRGYVKEASQGTEAIHDFYLDAWPGLQQRFDPHKGTFGAYATAAFRRFARRRMVEEAQWIRMLRSDAVDAASLERGADESYDLGLVRAAVIALDPKDRELLERRYGNPEQSEREISRDLGASRYVVRQRLARALAELAVRIDETGGVREDARVMRDVFVERKPDALVAQELGMTLPQIRAARRRVLEFFSRATGERR